MTDPVSRNRGLTVGYQPDPSNPAFQAAVRRTVNARAAAAGRGPQTHGYQTAGAMQRGNHLEGLVGPGGVALNGQFPNPFMSGMSPVSAQTETLIDDAVAYDREPGADPAQSAARWKLVQDAIVGEIKPLLPSATVLATADPAKGPPLTSEAQAKIAGLNMWALGTDRLAQTTQGAMTQIDTNLRMEYRDQHLDQTIGAVEDNLDGVQEHSEDESWLRQGWDWATGGGAGEEFEGYLEGKLGDLKRLDERDEALSDAEYERELQAIMGDYGKDFKRLSDDLKESDETWNTVEEVGRIAVAATAGIIATATLGPGAGIAIGLGTYEVIDGAGDVKDAIEGDDVYADGHSSILTGTIDLLGGGGDGFGMSAEHLNSWAKDNTIDALSSVTIGGSTFAGIRVGGALSTKLAGGSLNRFGVNVVSTTAGGMTAQSINGAGQLTSNATGLMYDNKLFTHEGGQAMLESAKMEGINFILAIPTSGVAGAIPIYRVASGPGKLPLNWAGIGGQYVNDTGSNLASQYFMDGDVSKNDAISAAIGGVPGTMQNIFIRASAEPVSANTTDLVVSGTGPNAALLNSGPRSTGLTETAGPVRYVTHIDADGNPSLGLVGPDGQTIAAVNAPWSGPRPPEVVVLETSAAPNGQIAHDAVHRLRLNADGSYSGSRIDADGNIVTYRTGGAGTQHPLEGIPLLTVPGSGQAAGPNLHLTGGQQATENGAGIPATADSVVLYQPGPLVPHTQDPPAGSAAPSQPINMRYSHQRPSGVWVTLDWNKQKPEDRVVYNAGAKGDEGEPTPPPPPTVTAETPPRYFVAYGKADQPPVPGVFSGFVYDKQNGEMIPRLLPIDEAPPQEQVVTARTGNGESVRHVNNVYDYVPVYYYDGGTWRPLEDRDPPILLKRDDPSDPYDAGIPFLPGRPTRRDGTAINDRKSGPLSLRSFRFGWRAGGQEIGRRFGPDFQKLRQWWQSRGQLPPTFRQGEIVDGVVVDRPMLDQMAGKQPTSSPDTMRFPPAGTLVDNVFGMPIEGLPVGTHVILRQGDGEDIRAIVVPKEPPELDPRRTHVVTTDADAPRTLGLIRNGDLPDLATESHLRLSETDPKAQDRGNTRGRGVDGRKSHKGQLPERSELIVLLFSRKGIAPATKLTPRLKGDVEQLIQIGLHSDDPEFRQAALDAQAALTNPLWQPNPDPTKLDQGSIDQLIGAAEHHPEADVTREIVRIQLHGREVAETWDPLMVRWVGEDLAWGEESARDIHVANMARNARSQLDYGQLPNVGDPVTHVQLLAVDDYLQASKGSQFTGRKLRGDLSPNGQTLLLAMAAQNPELRNLDIKELVRRLDLPAGDPLRLTGADFAAVGTRAAVGDLGRYAGDGSLIYLEEGLASTDPMLADLSANAMGFINDQPQFLRTNDPDFRGDRERGADLVLDVLRADKNSSWVSGTELRMHPSYKGAGKQSAEGQDVSDLSMALFASAGMWRGVRGYVASLAGAPDSKAPSEQVRKKEDGVRDKAQLLLARMPQERPLPGSPEYASIMGDFLKLFDHVPFDPARFHPGTDVRIPTGENLKRDWNNLKTFVQIFSRQSPDSRVNTVANDLLAKMETRPQTAEQWRDLGVDFVSLVIADYQSPYRTLMVVEDQFARMRDMQRAYRIDRMTPTQYAQEHWSSTALKEGVPWLNTLAAALGLPVPAFVAPIPTAQGYLEVGLRQNGPDGTGFLQKVAGDDAEGQRMFPQGFRPNATRDPATGEWILNADAVVKVTHQTETAVGMGGVLPVAPGVPVGLFGNAVYIKRTIRYVGNHGGRPGYNLLPKGTRLSDEDFLFLLGAMGGTPYKPEGGRWGPVHGGEQMLFRNYVTMPITRRNDTEWLLQHGIFRHLPKETAVGPLRQMNRTDKGGGFAGGVVVVLSPQLGTLEGGPVSKVYEYVNNATRLHPNSSPQMQDFVTAFSNAGFRWADPKTGAWNPEVRQALMALRGHVNGGWVDMRTGSWVTQQADGAAQSWHREVGGLGAGIVRGPGDSPITIDPKTGMQVKGPKEADRTDIRAAYQQFAEFAFEALPNVDADIAVPQGELRELLGTMDDPFLATQREELTTRISGGATAADFDILNRLLKFDVHWQGLQA